MTNLDSILKSRDITLLTKVHLVKAIVFTVVMYGCESWTIKKAACMPAGVWAQLCPIPCDPIDCSPPGYSVHGIFQARILELVAISSSRGSSWPRNGTCVSCIFCIGRSFFTIVPPGKPIEECWRIDALELWFWSRLFRVPWTARRPIQSILKEIDPEYSLEWLMLKPKL